MAREFVAPGTVEEVLQILAERGDSVDIVAGGTDLVVADRVRKRLLRDTIISIHRLDELRGIETDRDGRVLIGALTNHTTIRTHPTVNAAFSALADGSGMVGSRATQTTGTIGGNIGNASPGMDTGSPLLCLDTEITLRSIDGERTLPLAQFLLGPGRTARQPGELITGIRLPPAPIHRRGSAYIRHDFRAAMEIAIVGVGALLVADTDGTVTDARIALTAVAPTVVRAEEVEEIMRGTNISDLPLDEIAAAVSRSVTPITDVRASAEYRASVIPVIAERAIRRAIARLVNSTEGSLAS